MRDFNRWIANFRPSIANYEYYVDFKKVFCNVDELRIPLNILNSLIGSKDIESDFKKVATAYPETLRCIPILLAKRENEIMAMDEKGSYTYRFDKPNYTIDEYATFMHKTGLFDLIGRHIINNLA